ncbi:hypothetical protein [Domibacillus robiginosus]|uniref:hypothetical protein n=1 Tax=Domibacillus robiginosus TaxID=1071054 RepID=UPI00067CCC92|nr:hypothetical protein [Domibacillus robiginosus]
MFFKVTLAVLVLLGMITSILNSESAAEKMIWISIGMGGLIGALTFGKSLKKVRSEIKSK